MQKSIVIKITGLLFLMLFVAIANIATIYFYQIQQRHDAHIVNVAGRQRMLSQAISKFAFSVERGNVGDRKLLSEAIELYGNSLETLWHGGEAMEEQIPPAPAAIEKLFQENRAIWEPFKKKAELIVMEERDNAVFGEAVDYIDLNNNDLLKISSLITLTFDKIFSRKVLFLRGLLFAMLGMDILFFIIGYLMVVKIAKPLKTLSTIAAKIGRGDFTDRVRATSNDEIGNLTNSFNKMIENLKSSEEERKEAIEELKSAKDFSENILNSMTNGVDIVNEDCVIQFMNKAFTDTFGKDVIGKKCYEVYRINKKMCHLCPLKERIKFGETKTIEVSGIVGGKTFIISHTGMRNPDGSFAILEIFRDITELRETQEQLIQVEKMEAVGRMASGVAHEVKNPLGIVLQGINYFEGKLPLTQKDNREMLKMMKDSIKRADGIVRALLDFSRMEEFRIKPEDINSILESSVLLLQHNMRLKNIEVIKDFGKDLPKVLADKGKIEQVFVNIFSNAIHAMPKGGRLFIRTYKKRFNERRFRVGRRKADGDYFELEEFAVIAEIEDTGVGIPEDVSRKIFDPFFTTKKTGEGTGLGLSVVNKIMDMHRGFIDIKSKVGKGTKVTIALKLSKK